MSSARDGERALESCCGDSAAPEANRDSEPEADLKVIWKPTEAPGSETAHQRMLEILFAPRPGE